MKQAKIKAGLLVASFLSVLVLAAAPVWAEGGPNSSSGGSSDDSTATTSSTNQTSKTDGEPQTEVENDTTDSSTHGVREEAAKLLQDKRKDQRQERTQIRRQNACKALQNSFNRRADNYAAAAERHLNVFNDIFTKVQAFYTNKKLNVSNYDALVANATAKQTAATNAVAALKAADVTLDCTAPDPANTVATLKVAVANARQALKEYRTSLKDLVVALKGASTAQTDNSAGQGGDQ